MSLFLSALTYMFGNFGLHQLSLLSMLASTAWMGTAWWLGGLVPKQAQAEKMVKERRKKDC
jgi:Pyruvate/2-oxoacid:ferredoxin oxidoreductase gamma subunit